MSPHKFEFFEAIAALRPDVEVICFADQDLPVGRRDLGWSAAAVTGFSNIVKPSISQIECLFEGNAKSTFHVFSGIRRVPTIECGLKNLSRHGNIGYAIMSEPRVMEGAVGKLRLIQSWITEFRHRRSAAFILAIGRNGPPWFRLAGYSAERIFPFAYFVDPPALSVGRSRVNRTIVVGYVGRLVSEKGIFVLADGIKFLGEGAVLKIAGGGRDEVLFRKKCAELELDCEFAGVIPMPAMAAFFASIDVLVLASTTTDDGWGVVVSEALMAGVPVVATSAVGASVVLDDARLGRRISANAPHEIADGVRSIMASEDAINDRPRRAALATSMLSARAGAEAFLNILDWNQGMAPRPHAFYAKQRA